MRGEQVPRGAFRAEGDGPVRVLQGLFGASGRERDRAAQMEGLGGLRGELQRRVGCARGLVEATEPALGLGERDEPLGMLPALLRVLQEQLERLLFATDRAERLGLGEGGREIAHRRFFFAAPPRPSSRLR